MLSIGMVWLGYVGLVPKCLGALKPKKTLKNNKKI